MLVVTLLDLLLYFPSSIFSSDTSRRFHRAVAVRNCSSASMCARSSRALGAGIHVRIKPVQNMRLRASESERIAKRVEMMAEFTCAEKQTCLRLTGWPSTLAKKSWTLKSPCQMATTA